MVHVLLAGRLHPSGLAVMRAAPGFTFDYVEDVSEAAYVPLIGAAEALVIRTQPLTAETVAKAPRLRIVSRHGVGYDTVHRAALDARAIALAVVGDVNSVSVAEHAMMLLLAAAKSTLTGDRAVRDPTGWAWRNRLEPIEIFGRKLLIVGFGRIGRHLARMAAGFGMEIRAYDPLLAAQGWPETPVAPVEDLRAGLAWADAVSIHIPRADAPLLGPGEITAMKPGAILINTARGGIVDEAALVEALKAGRLRAAGLDVFEDEPPRLGNPLLALPQTILSPHVAGLSAECAERMAISAVRNVIDFFAGTIDPALIVNGVRPPGAAA